MDYRVVDCRVLETALVPLSFMDRYYAHVDQTGACVDDVYTFSGRKDAGMDTEI
jgi:hypothetical protein